MDDSDLGGGWDAFEDENGAPAIATHEVDINVVETPSSARVASVERMEDEMGVRVVRGPPSNNPVAVRAVRELRKKIDCDDIRDVRNMAFTVADQMVLRPAMMSSVREPVSVDDLMPIQKMVYDIIVGPEPGPDSDEQVMSIQNAIERGVPGIRNKMTGRIIDSTATRYSVYGSTRYFVLRVDPKRPLYVKREDAHMYDSKDLYEFDVSKSYHQKMKLFRKELFDPFGRSIEVWHTLSNGQRVPISLCRYHFYFWAMRFCVFQFIDDKYESIVRVQRGELRSSLQRKRLRDEAKLTADERTAKKSRSRKPVDLPDMIQKTTRIRTVTLLKNSGVIDVSSFTTTKTS